MAIKYENAIKKPGELSPRTKWLRDYYFEGVNRKWNNEYTGYTTGTPWDCQFDEMTYYIVPENHTFLSTFTCAFKQLSQVVEMPDGFWDKSLVERKADFLKECVVNQVPMEIIPGDLLCGSRFNIMTSMCLTEAEQKEMKDWVQSIMEKVLGKPLPREVTVFVDPNAGAKGNKCYCTAATYMVAVNELPA